MASFSVHDTGRGEIGISRFMNAGTDEYMTVTTSLPASEAAELAAGILRIVNMATHSVAARDPRCWIVNRTKDGNIRVTRWVGAETPDYVSFSVSFSPDQAKELAADILRVAESA